MWAGDDRSNDDDNDGCVIAWGGVKGYVILITYQTFFFY